RRRGGGKGPGIGGGAHSGGPTCCGAQPAVAAAVGPGAYGATAALGTARNPTVVSSVPNACTAAAANLRAETNRAAGSLAIALAITSSMRIDNAGTTSLTRGGGAVKCAAITAAIPLADANGGTPLNNRNSVHPNEYTSARPSKGSPANTSGAA